MATFKFTGGVSHFRDKLIDGMVANGYTPEFAEHTFKQLEGFGSYGFPESHAASFALIAYASAWMKCWHPDVFCAALLNSQPMGFYAPAQIVRDAQASMASRSAGLHQRLRWDCTLEPTGDDGASPSASACAWSRGWPMPTPPHRRSAGRRALCLDRRSLAPRRRAGRRPGPDRRGDAFRPSSAWRGARRSGQSRRCATSPAALRRRRPAPMAASCPRSRAAVAAPDDGRPEVVEDYGHVGLSLRSHPVSFLRDDLRRAHRDLREAMRCRDGRWLEAAGLVLVRQRPGSAKGVMFITSKTRPASPISSSGPRSSRRTAASSCRPA
jgi:error-prone DNA polymerase